MFTLLLLLPSQGDGPLNGLYVTRLPLSREAREAAIGVLTPTSSSPHDDQQTRLHIIPVLGTRVWIDEDAWQDQRMPRQRTLYENAGRLENPGPALLAFEAAAFAAHGRKGAPKPERKLVVSRRFILESGGRRFAALCRSGLTESAALIPAPPAVVAAEDPSTPLSPWVRYPTSYGFALFGAARRRNSDPLALRSVVIHLIDEHIDTFMKERSQWLNALAMTIDGVDGSDLDGKLVSQLPAAARKMISEATLLRESSSVPAPADWIETAVVISVAPSVFLEERDATGKVVDIELP
jgi:hypothetical protein